jgi:hypothetical protein
MIFPFFTRLLLYLVAMLMPLIHPSIVVPYDWTGWWVWFFLIPGEMTIAAFLSPPRFRIRFTLIAAGVLLFLSVLIGGISGSLWMVLAGGIVSFVLTYLIFKTKLLGRNLAVFEQFFLAFIYYKLLNFSRASEEVARASSGITQVLLVVTICSFLLHGLVLYFSGFKPGGKKRKRREVLVFSLIIPLFLFLAFALPPNFVEHSIVFNAPDDDLIKDIPYDSDGYPFDRGGRSDEGEMRNGEGDQQGELKGIPSDQWGNRFGEGENGGRQYAVMVVASEYNPVYAAESYFGTFDPERGFLYSSEEPLNELSYIRLLDTWRDENPPNDRDRWPFSVDFFSTIPEKVIPYRPEMVEPTILNKRYHPFDYTYHVISRVSVASDEEFTRIDGLRPDKKAELARYLEVSLPDEYREAFEDFLEEHLEGGEGYLETIDAILKSFTEFQYQLGFDDNVHIEKLYNFLTRYREGDCTEFSNTAAILGRMAGIPSRVVTGYLASRNLQTMAHMRGLYELQKAIEPLQQYPLESLYLVTTAHHHSWVQYYMPGYGWVDFETTSHAIPPPPGFDMNQQDVIIPLIEEVAYEEETFAFPWILMLKIFAGLAGAAIAGVYLFRYLRELVLAGRSRRGTHRSLYALLQLILMKKAADGWQVKKRWQTVKEYAEQYPAFRDFADLYTELRYRQRIDAEEKRQLWERIFNAYEGLKSDRRRGIFPALRRILSLRGLYY